MQRVSTVAAMTNNGIITTDFHTGSVGGDVFADFVHGSLIPQMQAFDWEAESSVAIMDNCSIHHTQAITDLFDEAGIAIIFPSPYCPDSNPTVFAFSSVKSYLRCHDMLLEASDHPRQNQS